jgi:hypothetical protein
VWLIGLIVAAVVLFLLGFVGLAFFSRSDSSSPPSATVPAPASR